MPDIKAYLFRQRGTLTDQRISGKKTESPKIDMGTCRNVSFDKGGISNHWGKVELFEK